jgi:hypothetical protein
VLSASLATIQDCGVDISTLQCPAALNRKNPEARHWEACVILDGWLFENRMSRRQFFVKYATHPSLSETS